MASTSAFSASQTGFSWQIIDLQNMWGTDTGYSSAYVTVSGPGFSGTSSPVYPPTTGTGYSTGVGSFSGLSPGTTYSVSGYVVFKGSTVAVTGTSITTQSPPPPPPPGNQGYISVSYTNTYAPSDITFSWSNPGGADYYKLTGSYTNSAYYGTSYTFSNASAGYYSLTVQPWNNYGSGGSSSQGFTLSNPPHNENGASLTGTTTNPGGPAPYSIQWTISGLSSPVSAYDSFKLNMGDGTTHTWSGSSSYTTTGHSANVQVSASAQAQYQGGWYNTGGTVTVTTPAVPPPSGTPTVSATRNAGQNSTAVTWSDVTGATSYDVYYNDGVSADVFEGSTTGHSLQTTFDTPVREYSTYTIKVIPRNTSGDGVTGTTTVLSPDLTAPVLGPATRTNSTDTTISWTLTGVSDPMPSRGSASGVRDRTWYRLNGSTWTLVATTTTDSYKFTGLTADTWYTFGAVVTDNDGNQSGMGQFQASTTIARPADWEWWTPKIQGENFNITAAEWTAFCKRINDFEAWKDLPLTTFPTFVTGADFTGIAYNQAAAAIANIDRLSYVAKQKGDDVTAAIINRLRDRLREIP